MITAHLPSGYALGKIIQNAKPGRLWVLPAAVLGGVLPDFDMIWFYWIDDRAFHHHRYWVHIPVFWAAIAVLVLPIISITARQFLVPALVFFAALLLHICLDTISGGILWQWPWSHELTHLITVPARFDHWIMNFILHPVFVLELMIWALAAWLWLRS